MPAKRNDRVAELYGDRRRRAQPKTPKPPLGDLAPPADLAPVVADVWAETIAAMQATGLLTRADRDVLRAWCEAVVVHRRASAELAAAPSLTLTREGGRTGKHPLLQVQRDATMTMLSCARALGMSPAARDAITVPGPPHERTRADDLLTGGGKW